MGQTDPGSRFSDRKNLKMYRSGLMHNIFFYFVGCVIHASLQCKIIRPYLQCIITTLIYDVSSFIRIYCVLSTMPIHHLPCPFLPTSFKHLHTPKPVPNIVKNRGELKFSEKVRYFFIYQSFNFGVFTAPLHTKLLQYTFYITCVNVKVINFFQKT